jgi:hypothetical protein
VPTQSRARCAHAEPTQSRARCPRRAHAEQSPRRAHAAQSSPTQSRARCAHADAELAVPTQSSLCPRCSQNFAHTASDHATVRRSCAVAARCGCCRTVRLRSCAAAAQCYYNHRGTLRSCAADDDATWPSCASAARWRRRAPPVGTPHAVDPGRGSSQ